MRNITNRSKSSSSRRIHSAKENEQDSKLNVKGRSLSSSSSKLTSPKMPAIKNTGGTETKKVYIKTDNLKASRAACNSDTESTDGNLEYFREPKSFSPQLNSFSSYRSVPDLSKGRISSFRKVISSPRQCLLTQFPTDDKEIIHEYCKR